MTLLMQCLSARGNNAYDAFRAGLVKIKAPSHVLELLPDFANPENPSTKNDTTVESETSKLTEPVSIVKLHWKVFLDIFETMWNWVRFLACIFRTGLIKENAPSHVMELPATSGATPKVSCSEQVYPENATTKNNTAVDSETSTLTAPVSIVGLH